MTAEPGAEGPGGGLKYGLGGAGADGGAGAISETGGPVDGQGMGSYTKKEEEREITIRTVNGFTTAVNIGRQNKHIVSSRGYVNGRSVFSGTMDRVQKLINKFAGTGEWIGVNKERIDFGEKIGQYIKPETGEKIDTTVGIIHYSKAGAHIVPARPQDKMR